MSELTSAVALSPGPFPGGRGEPSLALRAQKPRLDVVDYAKGIGILLVVVAHVWRGLALNGIHVPAAIQTYPDIHAMRNGVVDRWIYACHMPLFFFLSGLFLYRSAGKPAATFLRDKVSTIAWPFIVWTVIYWALQRFSKRVDALPPDTVDPRSLHGLCLSIVSPNGTHLWFLYTLFMIALAMLALRKLRAPAWSTLLIAMALIAAVWLKLLPVGPQTFLVISFLPFVAAAAVVAPRLIPLNEHARPLPLVLVAIACAAVITFTATRDPIVNPMFSPYSGWFGIALTLAVAKLFEWANWQLLRWLGVLSLEIYLVHIAAASVARQVLLKLHVEGWPIHLLAGVTAGVAVPIAIWWVGQRIGVPLLFRLKSPVLRKNPADVSGHP